MRSTRYSPSTAPRDRGSTGPRGPAYERACPNELWHIDIKGPFWLQRAPGEHTKVWIVGLVDDHSRYLIGLRVLPQPSTPPILAWLHDCFELCGQPLELMSGIQTRSGVSSAPAIGRWCEDASVRPPSATVV